MTFGSGKYKKNNKKLAILALPYSITKTGLILGFMLFFFASSSVFWTLKMLIKVALKNKSLNYSKIIEIYFGNFHTLFYEFMNLSSNLGSIIIYQQISKKKYLYWNFLVCNFSFSFLDYIQIPQVKEYPNLSRFIQMNLFAIFTQIPVTFIKHIEVLYKISYLGTFSLLYSVIVKI